MKNKLIQQVRKCLIIVVLCNWAIGSILLTVSSDSINLPSLSAIYTDLTDTPIFIDDSSTEYNWNQISSNNPWCTGKGTSEDPYIIQDIIISSTTSDSIIIANSDVIFMIANCIIHTSEGGGTRLGFGIVFDNVRNGIITNCEIFNNKHDGIGVYYSNNILIYNNYIHNNNGSGISIGMCSNIELNTNIIRHHEMDGIEHYNSNYSKIYNNEIAINDDGIILSNSSHNELTDNSIYDNYEGIFLLRYSHYNRIISNILSNNSYCIVIGTSCKDTYYNDNGECSYFSYNETWNPSPPPDDPEPDENMSVFSYDLWTFLSVIGITSIIVIIFIQKNKNFSRLNNI